MRSAGVAVLCQGCFGAWLGLSRSAVALCKPQTLFLARHAVQPMSSAVAFATSRIGRLSTGRRRAVVRSPSNSSSMSASLVTALAVWPNPSLQLTAYGCS